jgi:3-isopropylmalate/(R)-2-methylmalate dehydratase small subunit
MEPFVTHVGRAVVLDVDDVDTDQIIPARFLTTTSRQGLGKHLFADWRFDAAGVARPAFALNRPAAAGATILVAGRNFGCGSSREHAPWSLLDYGIRVVIATSFAEIFRSNALKVGLLPIGVSESERETLVAELRADASKHLFVDLTRQTVETVGGFRSVFTIDPFAQRCLLEGVDQLGFLLAAREEIARYERGHSSSVNTRA